MNGSRLACRGRVPAPLYDMEKERGIASANMKICTCIAMVRFLS